MSLMEHEVIRVFKQHVYPLCDKITEMLNEHYTHQTERRGCGYTQSTRLLAEYINSTRQPDDFQDLKLFQNYETRQLKKILEHKHSHDLRLTDWHNLDLQPDVLNYLAHAGQDEYSEALRAEVAFQQKLRTVQQYLTLEESHFIAELIQDIILPKDPQVLAWAELPALTEKPKVGSCPMAENFFLKIAHRHVLRQGEINIFVDEQQQPLLLEKLNMGDNHSCISLKPLLMNGVRLPVGSLFSVEYDRDLVANKRQNKEFKGYSIPYTAISGFWFLRLTTLVVSPQHRKRAFTTHFEQQVANGLYSPGITQMQQLIDVALAQVE